MFGLSKDTEDTALDLGTLGDLREWAEEVEVGFVCSNHRRGIPSLLLCSVGSKSLKSSPLSRGRALTGTSIRRWGSSGPISDTLTPFLPVLLTLFI